MVFLDLGTLRNAQILQEPIKSLCASVGIQGALRLLHEFSDGFSETRVVLGENSSGPNDLQPFRLVFKVGAADALRDEVGRYLDFVKHARAVSVFVPVWEAERTLKALPHDGSPAAIAYGYAGDVFGARDCVSFKSVFRECVKGERPVRDVEEMIETLARAVGSLYAAPKECYAHVIAHYYMEHWAPDYQVTADHLVQTESYPLLTLQRFNPDYFQREPQNVGAALRGEAESPAAASHIDIVLPRCLVAEVRPDRLVAWLNSPEDLSLHVNTRGMPPGSSARIEKGSAISLWAPKSVSRYDFYLRQVRPALPSLDVEAPTFEVGPLRLHNPFVHFSSPLLAATKPPASTYTVPGHGDLHPGNVLIAGAAPAIIDYGKSAQDIPLGVDAARFFGGLVRDVLAEELSFEELALVLADALGAGTFLKEDDDTPSSRAVRLLKLVVEKLVPAGVPEPRRLWPAHLYGYAWVGLKWANSPPESYRACFLLAGVALQSLLGPAPAGATDRPAAPADDGGQKPQQQPITAARPIKPEGPAEILILVSRFDGSANYDPTVRIFSTLADHVFETLGKLARVERVEDVISSRREAVALAERYRASMIVWGTFDDMGVSPHYEVTRDSLVIKQSMIQLDQATRHQLSERFEPYITQNLAEEVSFLSLKAVAEMCILNLNFDSAIKVYDRALSLIPDRERARELGAAHMYRSLAAVYLMLKMNERAKEANDKARELDPENLMTGFQDLLIRSLLERKSGIQSIEDLKAVLRTRLEGGAVGPGEAEGLRALLAKLEPLRTSADFRKLLEPEKPATTSTIPNSLNKQFSKDVMVHLQRALTLFETNKFQATLKEVRAALRLNPRCAQAFIIRGRVLAVTDHVGEGLKEIEKAEKLNPKEYYIYQTRGDILGLLLQDYSGALQQYEKAFGLEPEAKQRAVRGWGEAMLGLGRGEEAMRLVREWDVAPNNTDLYIFRSQYYRNKEEYAVALREADQAIRLSEVSDADEDPPLALQERAEVYEAMGRRDLAMQDLEKAIRLSVKGTFLRRILSQRLDELRSLSEAAEGEESDADGDGSSENA